MLGVSTWFSAVLLLLISNKSAVLTEAPSWDGETPDPNGPVVIPNATLDVMYGETVSFAREYLFQYQYTFAEVKAFLLTVQYFLEWLRISNGLVQIRVRLSAVMPIRSRILPKTRRR
jgi:hypothetical protein